MFPATDVCFVYVNPILFHFAKVPSLKVIKGKWKAETIYFSPVGFRNFRAEFIISSQEITLYKRMICEFYQETRGRKLILKGFYWNIKLCRVLLEARNSYNRLQYKWPRRNNEKIK